MAFVAKGISSFAKTPAKIKLKRKRAAQGMSRAARFVDCVSLLQTLTIG